MSDKRGANPSVVPDVINRAALRQYVLTQAEIEDIPFFWELTALYAGCFLAQSPRFSS